MKTTKKLLALLLASLMVVGTMSACKSTSDDKGTDKDKDTSSDSSKDDSDADSFEPAYDGDTGFDIGEVEKFVMYGGTKNGYTMENPVGEVLKEKTGVDFEFIEVIGDPDEAIALLASGGEFPDLVYNPSSQSMQLMVELGAYLELEDLIEEYAPNVKEYYGDYFSNLTYSADYPHVYAIGGEGQVGDYAPGYYWQEGLFYVQSDVLAARDYPEIKTLEQYADLIEDELTANPTMEDGSKRFGLSLNLDGWRYSNVIMVPSESTGGLPVNGGAYYVAEDGKVASTYDSEHFKTMMSWYNDMFNKGLIDPESFTQTYDTYISKIANGSCVGNIDAYWSFFTGEDQLRATYPEKTYMGFQVVADENTEWAFTEPASPINVTAGLSITTACKNPEKLLNFTNYINSEEGYILREWGIEGTNYTIEDGLRVRNPEDVAADAADGEAFTKKTGVKLYSRGTPIWFNPAYGFKTSNGQLLSSEDPTTSTAGYTESEKAFAAAYGLETLTDMARQPSTYDTVRNYGRLNTLATGKTDDTKVAGQKIKDALPKTVAALIQAPAGEFETVWAEWIATLEANGQEMLTAEMNESYDARLALWGIK